MILGMSTEAFTIFHVALSLIGIATGLVWILALTGSTVLRVITPVFLISTVLTSLTGFLFPNKTITPGIALGILSMIALILAIFALYAKKLDGAWRGTYIISASIALYFNLFVLFAQLFAKVPALKAAAPTMASPAFGLTQLIVLLSCALLTVRALRKFRPL